MSVLNNSDDQQLKEFSEETKESSEPEDPESSLYLFDSSNDDDQTYEPLPDSQEESSDSDDDSAIKVVGARKPSNSKNSKARVCIENSAASTTFMDEKTLTKVRD